MSMIRSMESSASNVATPRIGSPGESITVDVPEFDRADWRRQRKILLPVLDRSAGIGVRLSQ